MECYSSYIIHSPVVIIHSPVVIGYKPVWVDGRSITKLKESLEK